MWSINMSFKIQHTKKVIFKNDSLPCYCISKLLEKISVLKKYINVNIF